MTQLLLPLAATLGLTLLVGGLIGQAYLALGGLGNEFFANGMFLGGGMAIVATLMAIAAGLVVTGRSLRIEDLRRE